MSNEFHDPPVDFKGLSLRVQEQIRRKFLPLCTEDEKQQVQTTLMPMVYFAPSTVSNPSQHVLVSAKIPDQCPELLRWAVACFIYGMDKIEAAKKNGEYVRANREQFTRFQIGRGPCVPLPKPPPRSRKTGQKRRASQTLPGDAEDDDDGQRRVKSKTFLTQSNSLDSETKKKVREAANESRLMELKNADGSREDDLINREANLMQREADLERNELELTYRKSAFDSREAALDSREASVVQREADLERTLGTRQTASDSRSTDLDHSETAINHQSEALKAKEADLDSRVKVLDLRSIELLNLEVAMDIRATELNNRETALNTRESELNNREVVLETRNTELNNLEAAVDTRNTELNNREAALETRNTELNILEAAVDTRNTELNNRDAALETRNTELNILEAAVDTRNTELNNREVVLETRNTEMNNRETVMDIRDAKLKSRDTILRSYETDLDHCEVVSNSLPADLTSCEASLESCDTEAYLGKQESDADDSMATSAIGASQPDNALKREKDENSATPPAQTAPRFDKKYIEEYQKCYNRATLDIMLLRGLGDAERRNIQDEQFRDALMEEFKQRTESLADATNSALRIFDYLSRS